MSYQRGQQGLSMDGLCLGLMALAAFTSSWSAVRLGGIQVVDLFLCLSAVGLACEFISRRPLRAPPMWVLYGCVGVLVVMVLSESFPPAPGYFSGRYHISGGLARLIDADLGRDGVTKGLQWIVAMLMVPMLIIFVGERSKRALKYLAVAWVAGAAVSALVAASDFMGVSNIALTLLGQVSITGRQTGLATHPNSLGVPCALAAPMCVIILKRTKYLGSATLLLLGLGVLLSGSRGAQAGILVALVLVAWFSGKAPKLGSRLLIPGLLAGASLLLLPQSLVSPGLLLLRISDSSASVLASNEGRLLVAAQGVDDFFERPFFGIGLEWITYAHSIYLQVLSAGGLMLLASTAVYFGGALRAGVRSRPKDDLLVAAALASVLSWLAMGVIENQLTDRYLYFTIGILAAYELFGRRSGWLNGSHSDGSPDRESGNYSGAPKFRKVPASGRGWIKA